MPFSSQRRHASALRLALVLLASLLVPVFAHADEVPEDARERLIESLRKRREAVSALRGRAQIVVTAPEWKGSSQAEAAIVAQRPASLRLRAWVGPTTLFDVVGVRDTCGAHLVRYGAYARGPCETLSSLGGIPFEPADFVEGLFGEPYLNEDSLVIDGARDGRIMASWPAPGGGRVHGEFRRSGYVPLQYEWRDGERVRARLRYDDFLKEKFGPWPRLIDVEWPEREAKVRLRFHELDLDPELESTAFAIVPPEGALVLDWGEAMKRAEELER